MALVWGLCSEVEDIAWRRNVRPGGNVQVSGLKYDQNFPDILEGFRGITFQGSVDVMEGRELFW